MSLLFHREVRQESIISWLLAAYEPARGNAAATALAVMADGTNHKAMFAIYTWLRYSSECSRCIAHWQTAAR